MTFVWSQMLWLLGAVPLLVALYFAILRLSNKRALRYASFATVKAAVGRGQGMRRAIPPACLLIGLTILIFSVARPIVALTLPSQRSTIILAMDISGSMSAADVEPDRITAAQVAAKDFVKGQPRSARIGLVAFSTSAVLVQPPTRNREKLFAAVDLLSPQRFTAVGSGILVSLKAIFPEADIDQNMASSFPDDMPQGVPLGQPHAQKQEVPFLPVAPGSYRNAAIILMSDGQTNTGADPIEAAHIAASRGVRVFTVGFGTEAGMIEYKGRAVRVQLDEGTLQSIADITRGTYFRAGSASQLKRIYNTLTTKLIVETRRTEITAIFAAAGAFFVILAGTLSVLWFGRFT